MHNPECLDVLLCLKQVFMDQVVPLGTENCEMFGIINNVLLFTVTPAIVTKSISCDGKLEAFYFVFHLGVPIFILIEIVKIVKKACNSKQ